MNDRLHALLVEDSEDDALLVVRALQKEGYKVTFGRVETKQGLIDALNGEPWDLVISDFTMPKFSGLDALKSVREGGFDVPFIFVSGTIGEEVAVSALKNGANDYVLKGQLARLGPSVNRELREVGERRARRQAEKALEISQARLAEILETAVDAIISVDENQLITLFNMGAEKMFGYVASEVLRQPIDRLLPSRYVKSHRELIARFAGADSSTGQMGSRRGVLGRRRDGTEFPGEATISKVARDGWTSFTVILRDVSDRKQMEDRLRQAQKMEAVGQLAGGVAHDFNNLLTIINGYGELMLQRLDLHDPAREMLLAITGAGSRAATLTHQLLAFSRKTVLEPRILDLNVIVMDTERMLRRLISEDIVLITMLQPDLDLTKVDPGQVEQIIMNLVVNARDAMPEGGNLTIETRTVQSDESHAVNRPEFIPGRYVLLAVTDTGTGMSTEIQSHIFEPFFTTKELGKGTGLGLATVYGIVKQSNGYIYVDSELGQGTSFKVYLPSVNDSVPTEAPLARTSSARGTETLLLIEDDAAVRAVARFSLEQSGYTVLEACNGADAIQVYEQYLGPIHMVISDVVMPKMSGRLVVERLRQLNPDLKVLYLSGYMDDAVVRHGILEADVAFLQKPFTAVSLTNKVRDELDKAD